MLFEDITICLKISISVLKLLNCRISFNCAAELVMRGGNEGLCVICLSLFNPINEQLE